VVEIRGWEGGGEEKERLGGVFEGACAVVFGRVGGVMGIGIKVLFKRELR
jgi:hypothetical protein